MTFHNNSFVVLVLFISIISLSFGIYLQTTPMSSLMLWMGFIILWLMIVSFWGFTLKTNLVLISLIFLKPSAGLFFTSLALLAVTWVIDRYQQGSDKLYLPFPMFFFVMVLFGVLALLRTYVTGGNLYFTATVIVPLVCYVLINNIDRSDNDFLTWTQTISSVAVFLSLYGVIIAILNPADRIGSTWSNAMTINGFYTIGFFFALANAAQNARNNSKILWIAYAFVIFLGMVYTYTRIALVAVFFGLMIMMIRIRRIRFYAILSLGLMVLFIPSSMAERISTGMEYDLSIIIRFIVWTKSLEMIIQHPLTGIGFSTWKDIYHGMIPFRLLYAQHAHNLVLNIALEMGLIGAMAFFWIIFTTLRKYYKLVIRTSGDSFHYIVWVAVLALMVACLTDIFIQQYQISLVFWITMALMYRETKRYKPKEGC